MNYRELGHDEMFAKLGGFGSNIEKHKLESDIAVIPKPQAFQQSTFKKNAETHKGDRSIGITANNGYCAGVALEWIRRALLGGSKKHNDDPSYLTFGYKELVEKLDATPKNTKAYGKLQRMLVVWKQQDAYQPNTKRNESAKYDVEKWPGAALGFDNRSQEFKGKEKDRTRPMTDLKLQSGKEYKNITWEKITKVLTKKSFVQHAGNAAKLGFGNGQRGHAIAIWRRRKGTEMHDAYYFFDPNFGLFSYNLTGLDQAMTALFGWSGVHIPRYEYTVASNPRDSHFRIEIFGPAHCVDAPLDLPAIDWGGYDFGFDIS